MKRAVLAAVAALALIALLPAPPALARESEEPFEIVPGSYQVTPSTSHAGAHEDLTVSFEFAHQANGQTHNDVKDVAVNLPAGFMGNNTAVPTCTQQQLLAHGETEEELNNCPPASQIGTITFETNAIATPPTVETWTAPLYNTETTSFGLTASLGFSVASVLTQTNNVSVRPGDTGLTVTAPDIERFSELHRVSVTTWGLPADPVHDPERGRQCHSYHPEPTVCLGGGEHANVPVRPFLSNPTRCGSFTATLKADSWEHPGEWSEAETEVGPIDECDRVPFDPAVKATPTTDSAETSTGLGFEMDVPQRWSEPLSVAVANLKDARITLPEGMSLNPSAGSGLGSCSEAQLAEETSEFVPGQGCPPESKVGTVEIETPVLAEKAEPVDGSAVYVATPFQNPFHSLLALYLVAKIPSRGVIVKAACEVEADHTTGQLTTSCLDNPQQPFSRFNLSFRQGATSPLVTPPTCGSFNALAALTPWSDPLNPLQLTAPPFAIESGVDGAACPGEGTLPFHPGLIAGSINNAAGHYTPFYIRLSRHDGEQEITHFSIKLPPGVSGKLAGIPECSDAQIAQAKLREHEQGAAEEEASSSCPAASEVGRTLVEAGVGNTLAQVPGKVYLAGPYHGSNLSVVAITNAKVGPFDLGTVVVREALKIDPETAEVFVDSQGSDPLPHIVDGIPTHLREVRIYMDRPEFVLNPTNCKATSTASTVLGSGKDFVSEADDVPVTVTSPFQAADCVALGFKPKLALSLKGGTRRGATPAFKAVLTARKGDANIAKSVVTLPHSEFLEQSHIGTVCTRAQFKQGQVPGEKCPPASVYGSAEAITPILSEPLKGPVYLRSSSHNLPDLVVALHNSQVDIALDGRIDSVHGRIRNTFEAVPDAPVSRFVLEMQGGRKGLLVNSTNLCRGKHRVISEFTGQNGKIYDTKPVLKAKCPKEKKGKSGGKGKRHR